MLRVWDAIEADFLRDYGIRLAEQIDSMTWRQFSVLLHNLTPDGAVAARVREELERAKDSPEDDEAAATDFFTSVLGMSV